MAKMIKLTQNQYTTVDDEDYEEVSKYKWCAWYNKCTDSYYVKKAIRRDGKKRILNLHRWLLGVTDPKLVIDHINGDTLDNRRSNLRICTKLENNKNHTKTHKKNTSGFRGVCWSKEKQKWKAFFHLNKKHKHIGYYNDIKEAAKAFNKAAKEHYGEFCGKLNEVD